MKAYEAACRRVLRLGAGLRPMSDLANPNCKRVCVVDTLAIFIRLGNWSFRAWIQSRAQAQAITDSVLNDCKANVYVSYVSKINMHEDHHFLLLQQEIRETRNDILKMLTDSRHEFDRGIDMVRAQLEATKCDVIKFCIGTLASTFAVGLAVLCSRHHWF